MRKTILYIAMSLDGYIAEKNGGVDWLSGHNPEENSQNSYEAFTEEIDTVIMGWNTYYQVVTELSPKEWVYKDFETYVITHRAVSYTHLTLSSWPRLLVRRAIAPRRLRNSRRPWRKLWQQTDRYGLIVLFQEKNGYCR